MNVVVLAGGVGGSRFLTGMRAHLRQAQPDAELTAIVNTGDDLWLAGLRITPDLDTIMYTLAGINDTTRGWGRVGETERVSGELRELGRGMALVHARRPRCLGIHRPHGVAARQSPPARGRGAAPGALAADRRAAAAGDRRRGRDACDRRRPRTAGHAA